LFCKTSINITRLGKEQHKSESSLGPSPLLQSKIFPMGNADSQSFKLQMSVMSIEINLGL